MHTFKDREQAVRYAVTVLRRSSDWQEIQDALANQDRFAWVFEDDDASEAQAIIRDAEERCIADGTMPANYA